MDAVRPEGSDAGIHPGGPIVRIATEKDVGTVSELRDFLSLHAHPVMERWTAEETETADGINGAVPVFFRRRFPGHLGGLQDHLQDARITADRVIIEPIQPEKSGG